MDLGPLFDEPILAQQYLSPGYEDHASDVWLVRTSSAEVVVRRSRITEYPVNPFQLGMHHLFGVDPRRVFDLAPLNDLLAELSPIPVPRVLRLAERAGIPYAVVQRMPGVQLMRFTDQPPAMMRQLGQALARIHGRPFDRWGSPAGPQQFPLADFPSRVAATLRALARTYYPQEPALLQRLTAMCQAAEALPAPRAGALIMPDIDPSQFLAADGQLTALVDTEFYALGPRELDLIALEYVLDQPGATAFAKGYACEYPLPDLTQVRPVYRFLFRLMEIQGSVPMARWLAQPPLW